MMSFLEILKIKYRTLLPTQKMIVIIVSASAFSLILAFSLNGIYGSSISNLSKGNADISGTWIYKYGPPGYEPSVKIELEIMDSGSYYLSIKNMDDYSVERGSWSVDGNVLQLMANNGNSKTCSFTSSSIRYGRYYLERQ